MLELNAEQKAASELMDGHVLVLAGPGTGKTSTLVGRYLHLTNNGIDPENILCCTFSRNAADELKFRISEASGTTTRALPIGTFHSLSLRVLRAIGEPVGINKDFDIWTKDWERLDVVTRFQKELIEEGIYQDVDPDETQPARALDFIDASRESMLDPEDASIRASDLGRTADIAHADVYHLYEEYLNTENRIDFPRMVQWACKALAQDAETGANFGKQFSHILVDEYQDINLAQKTLIDSLISSGGCLWAVGDDFQAIYGWRGSDVRYLLGFEKNYTETRVTTLEKNYRSGKTIIDTANNLSNTLAVKIDKELNPTRSTGGEVLWDHFADEENEALAIAEEIQRRVKAGVPCNQIALLARTNKLPVSAVHTLIQRGIPVALRGGVDAFSEYEARLLLTAVAISSEQRTESKWSLRLNPGLYGFAKKLVGEDWSRRVKALTTYIQKRPRKGLSDEEREARDKILDRHRDYILGFDDAASLFGVLKPLLDTEDDSDRVFVGTIHSAKGLEWDSVFVMGWEDGVLPQRQSGLPRVLEEEKRIAYVAITRAKNFLMLSSVSVRGNRNNDLSPFLDGMGFLEEPEPEISPTPRNPISDPGKARDEFLSHYSSRELSPEERLKWIRHLRELRVAAEKEENDRIADGEGGDGSGWSDQAAGTGLLAEAGYTVRKDGPFAKERHDILADVLHGRIQLPDWLSESVQSQWGIPNTRERFTKIRNTINVALGNQKGRRNPSLQAIEKWEADLAFLDQSLLSQLISEAES